jgi:hypothetical protein
MIDVVSGAGVFLAWAALFFGGAADSRLSPLEIDVDDFAPHELGAPKR